MPAQDWGELFFVQGRLTEELERFPAEGPFAPRIAGQARGREILVSAQLKQLTGSAGDVAFDEGREVGLKGLSGTHRVYAVAWEEG